VNRARPPLPLIVAGVALILTKSGRRALLVAGLAAGVTELLRRRAAEGTWHEVPPPQDAGEGKYRSASGL
jgi:hypothetical protein